MFYSETNTTDARRIELGRPQRILNNRLSRPGPACAALSTVATATVEAVSAVAARAPVRPIPPVPALLPVPFEPSALLAPGPEPVVIAVTASPAAGSITDTELLPLDYNEFTIPTQFGDASLERPVDINRQVRHPELN